MNKKPHILYWKWNEDIFEDGVLLRKTQDIISRSMFDYIYVSFHFTSADHKILVSDALIQKIEEVTEILESNGRHLILDLDIRHEKKYFDQTEHAEHVYWIKPVCGKLDAVGSFETAADSADGIMKCWAAETAADAKLIGSIVDISHCVALKDGMITVQTDPAMAGWNVICYVSWDMVSYSKSTAAYDLMGQEFRQARREMFERVKHIPVKGVATDEWGMGVKLELPTVNKKPGNSPFTFSNMEKEENVDLNFLPINVEWLYYSDGMEQAYANRYGVSLKENFLFLWHYPEGDLQKSVETVNRYIENIRCSMKQSDAEFFDLGKEFFGEDCFIACHPTWWGDELDNAFDCVKNGLDWWEVKRDYAQTDELLPIPVRLAMMRKCKENVWYNMWYSMRTMDINTYYRETWINARFGGRTHHLGYECNEPGIVLELYPEGMLESLSRMEEKIEQINCVLDSRPDARVLILFGYEAATNWKLSDPNALYITRRNKTMHKVLSFTKELFEYPYLCELAPTTEVDNGSIILTDGSIAYMGHEYDAVILLMADHMSDKAYQLVKTYGESGGNLLTVGAVSKLKSGEDADGNFPSKGQYPECTNGAEIAEKLLALGIPQMCGKNFCVYENGKKLYTSDGQKNVDNIFCAEVAQNGTVQTVECCDYMITD